MAEQSQQRVQSPGQAPGGSAGPSKPEYISGKIAKKLQADLDEYLVNNPEFPVSSPGGNEEPT
jgi:hypothetical protein